MRSYSPSFFISTQMQMCIRDRYQGADKNSYGSVYVQGINYLYEFSCGPLSGWMYPVSYTHLPDKTEYYDGDSFDAAGMEVTAYYSDGGQKAVTDYEIISGESLEV